MCLAVMVVLETVPNTTILLSTLISVALVLPLYFTADESLTDQVCLSGDSTVRVDVVTLVTLAKTVFLVSVPGFGTMSSLTAVMTPAPSTLPITRT